MYLHLGQNTVVPQKAIVALLDLDNSSQSHITREFLSRAEKEGRVVNVSDDLPKSVALVYEDGRTLVYLSQLSSATLLKRCEEKRLD